MKDSVSYGNSVGLVLLACFIGLVVYCLGEEKAPAYSLLARYTDEGNLTGGYSCARINAVSRDDFGSKESDLGVHVVAVQGTRSVVFIDSPEVFAILELGAAGWVEKYRSAPLEMSTFSNAIIRGDFLAVEEDDIQTRVFSIRSDQVTLVGSVNGSLISLEETSPGQVRLFVNTKWRSACDYDRGRNSAGSPYFMCELAFAEYDVQYLGLNLLEETELPFNVTSRRSIAITKDHVAFAHHASVFSGYQVKLMSRSNSTFSTMPSVSAASDVRTNVENVEIVGDQVLVVRSATYVLPVLPFKKNVTIDTFVADTDGAFQRREPFPTSILKDGNDIKIDGNRVGVKFDIFDMEKSTRLEGIRLFEYAASTWDEDKSLTVTFPAESSVVRERAFAFDRTGGRLVYSMLLSTGKIPELDALFTDILLTLPDECTHFNFSGAQLAGIVVLSLVLLLATICAALSFLRRRTQREKEKTLSIASPEL